MLNPSQVWIEKHEKPVRQEWQPKAVLGLRSGSLPTEEPRTYTNPFIMTLCVGNEANLE